MSTTGQYVFNQKRQPKRGTLGWHAYKSIGRQAAELMGDPVPVHLHNDSERRAWNGARERALARLKGNRADLLVVDDPMAMDRKAGV